jgi:hypothetical protein
MDTFIIGYASAMEKFGEANGSRITHWAVRRFDLFPNPLYGPP